METLTRDDARRQKAGGVAALYLALAYLAAMPYFLLVVDYQGATTAADKVALIVGNYASMYAMYLVTYVFFGIALGVLAFALLRQAAGRRARHDAHRHRDRPAVVGRAGDERDGLQLRDDHHRGPRQDGPRAGPTGVAGDRAGRAGARRSRRRDPRRAVGPAGELGGAAKRRAAEGSSAGSASSSVWPASPRSCRRCTTPPSRSGCCRSCGSCGSAWL